MATMGFICSKSLVIALVGFGTEDVATTNEPHGQKMNYTITNRKNITEW